MTCASPNEGLGLEGLPTPPAPIPLPGLYEAKWPGTAQWSNGPHRDHTYTFHGPSLKSIEPEHETGELIKTEPRLGEGLGCKASF